MINENEKNKILHCAKQLVKIEKLFNAEVEKLLNDLGLIREEVHNEIVSEKTDT